MKQEKILTLTLSQLKQLYKQELPALISIAQNSPNEEKFKIQLNAFIDTIPTNNTQETIKMLIDYDGKSIFELSTGQNIQIKTISLLYRFLTENLNDEETPTDLFIDLYFLFKGSENNYTSPSLQQIKKRTHRWESGLDKKVIEIREQNKERILHILIQKIENRKTASRYHFESDLNYNEKYELVKEWWNDFRFHLSTAVKSPKELNRFLGNSLSDETMYLLQRAKKIGMPFFVTPYYLSLLNINEEGYNDISIRSYILYSPELVETYGHIKAWEKEDIVKDGRPNAAGWLLPEGHNIHRRYPEVAILIPDTMGRACGGLCASCQRMYDFQSERLNFEFENLRPKESWEKNLND